MVVSVINESVAAVAFSTADVVIIRESSAAAAAVGVGGGDVSELLLA